MRTGATLEYLSILEAYIKEKIEIMTHNYARTDAVFYVQKWVLRSLLKKIAVQKLTTEVAEFQYLKQFKSNPNSLSSITIT